MQLSKLLGIQATKHLIKHIIYVLSGKRKKDRVEAELKSKLEDWFFGQLHCPDRKESAKLLKMTSKERFDLKFNNSPIIYDIGYCDTGVYINGVLHKPDDLPEKILDDNIKTDVVRIDKIDTL